MSWTLAGSPIPPPSGKTVTDDVVEVVHRGLDGTYGRDFVGASKKVIRCRWDAISSADWSAVMGHFIDQRDHGTAKPLVVGELAFSGNVLISVDPIDYNIPRTYDYFSWGATFVEQ